MPLSRMSPLRAAARLLCAAASLLGLVLAGAALTARAGEAPVIRLKVAGGLADVTQYVLHEEPFWTRRVPEITGGRVRAEIAPFDRSGIRAQEALQLVRLGVIPFGDVLLGMAAGDDPELNAVDLPILNSDIAALRRTVELWRPRLESLLRERYEVELLAVYTYPPQVMFCRQPFSGLTDLAGRRVRTSSVGQAELVSGLGGIPIMIPFASITSSVRDGVVDCAITGALSGNAIGLHEVTSYISPLPINWGVSVFVANQAAWSALPEAIRDALRKGLRELEAEIWQAADRETEEGLACNAGRPGCAAGRPGRMIVVEERWQDEARRLQLVRAIVLPSWVRRCGTDCAEAWNRVAAPAFGLWAKGE